MVSVSNVALKYFSQNRIALYPPLGRGFDLIFESAVLSPSNYIVYSVVAEIIFWFSAKSGNAKKFGVGIRPFVEIFVWNYS